MDGADSFNDPHPLSPKSSVKLLVETETRPKSHPARDIAPNNDCQNNQTTANIITRHFLLTIWSIFRLKF
jgi:hypothetical protein